MSFALLLGLLQAPTPSTVNGQPLGTSAEFSTAGPSTVCMREMAVTARAGEAVHLKYAGIHAGTLTLVSGHGFVDFDNGDIWKKPKRRGMLVSEKDGIQIFRTRRDAKLAYQVWVQRVNDEGKSENQPLVWATGSLLSGASADLETLARLEIKLDGPKDCDRTYTYGWPTLFGDEALSTKKEQ